MKFTYDPKQFIKYSTRGGFHYFNGNAVLKNKIISGASEQELCNTAKTEIPGISSLEEDGMQKVKQGITSVQELLRVLGAV